MKCPRVAAERVPVRLTYVTTPTGFFPSIKGVLCHAGMRQSCDGPRALRLTVARDPYREHTNRNSREQATDNERHSCACGAAIPNPTSIAGSKFYMRNNSCRNLIFLIELSVIFVVPVIKNLCREVSHSVRFTSLRTAGSRRWQAEPPRIVAQDGQR